MVVPMKLRWKVLILTNFFWMGGCDRTPSRSIGIGDVHLAYSKPKEVRDRVEDPWTMEGEGLSDFNRVAPEGPLAKLVSKFTLEGDFEIVADYVVERLDQSSAGDGNDGVEVAITSPDRAATVFSRRQSNGEGRGFYHFQKGMPQPSNYFDGVPSRSGRIGFRRVDATLYFLIGPAGGSLATMGSVDFFGRDPITEVALIGSASSGTSKSSLRFERLTVRGEEVVQILQPTGRSPTGVFLTLFLALGVLLLIAAAKEVAAAPKAAGYFRERGGEWSSPRDVEDAGMSGSIKAH